MLKKEVLRNRKDFSRIYGKGKSVGDRYVVLFYMKNGLDYNRRAFLASKKVGNSVQRNRARRLMKECWKKEEQNLPAGYDFIIIARNSINGTKCQQVEGSVKNAIRRTKLQNKKRI
jgi:ribonuclease P protein component